MRERDETEREREVHKSLRSQTQAAAGEPPTHRLQLLVVHDENLSRQKLRFLLQSLCDGLNLGGGGRSTICNKDRVTHSRQSS